MEFLVGLILGTRLFAILSGSPGELAAHFAPPHIVITEQTIRMRCALIDPFPADLRKLAAAATPIILYVVVEVHEKGVRQPQATATAESVLEYDIIEKHYRISQNIHPGVRSTGSLDSAIAMAAEFEDIPLCSTGSIDTSSSYYFVAYAILGKTTVAALNNRRIDCMYYWNYKRPTVKTEPISGRELRRAAGGG